MNALEISKLTFAYGNSYDVLKDVSFVVEEGSYVSIIGHNGSGKSTLAKQIIGLLNPKYGTIIVDGEVLNEQNIVSIRKKIGIVFQNPDNQFIASTVEDDIAFGLENKNVPAPKMREIVYEFATKVGMGEYLNKEPSSLSGGQKQRVAIAGVLAMNPSIVIFDEATSMLDPKGKKEIRQLILKMREENPKLTILSITHDVEEAYQSDYVLVLNEGRLILKGQPEDVFSHEKVLSDIGLTSPLVFTLKKKLMEKGIDCSSAKTIEQLANEVCLLK